VLRRQGLAVHVVGEDGLAGVLDRQRPFVALSLASLDALVESTEEELDCVVAHAGLFEQRGERGAAPLCRANGLGQPWLAHRTGLEQGAAVAGALEGDRLLHPLPLPQGIEGKRQWAFHSPCDLQAEARGVDRRDVVVDQEVVQARRGDRVPQRLERKPVVASGEPQLGSRDSLVADGAGGRCVHAGDFSPGRPRRRSR
jgi:hypothetical protein